MTARPVQTTSVRLSSATSEKLAELAQHTRRSEKELVDQAVDDYVERELAIISGIQLGLDDMRAGRVTPHADVMRELDEIIVQAEPPRTKA
jgi:predicted transcriptional regulator